MSIEDEVGAAIRKGDLLAAYDRASIAIATGPASERLRYLQLLALARMGDTARALELYREYRFDESSDVDCLALRGRLLKDTALAGPREGRETLLAAASAAYRDVFDRTGDYFPGINAASLALLAGEPAQARVLAGRVLALPAIAAPHDYFAAATGAEARLVLGDVATAVDAMRAAAALGAGDAGALSSTHRQLGLLADAIGLTPEQREAVLAPVRAAPVLVYSGSMFRGDDAAEAALMRGVVKVLDRHGIRVAYGALACGADIVIAEALLRRGAELNVVLPFASDDFERYSVAPGGAHWLARYRACLAGADSVDFASHARFVGDDNQFAYGGAVAMGLARLRARHLGAEALQLAVWDGQPGNGIAGTASDVARWRALGGTVEVVDPGPVDRRLDPLPVPEPGRWPREMRAILFGDFAGFSRLGEPALPQFWELVMERAGAVLDRYRHAILGANTWGDALFAYTADIADAAGIALELQQALAEVPLAELGLDQTGGMRLGVHFGPVYAGRDPVTGRDNIFGTEVIRTARVEPVTPTGDVYATHQFAAMLELDAAERFALGYVGTVPLAKGYGELKMFRLSPPLVQEP